MGVGGAPGPSRRFRRVRFGFIHFAGANPTFSQMASTNRVSRRSRSIGLLALLLAVPAWPARAADTEILHYTARLHGARLLDVTLCLRLDALSYSASMAAHTVGLAEMLVHGRTQAAVDGVIDGIRVKPHAYTDRSRLSGEDYAVTIAYPDGNPVLRMSAPPQAKYRMPVSPADLPGAMDGLSALALQSLVTTRTGNCKGAALIYDGRQLRRATTHAEGREVLESGPHSVFAGPALRCDTDSAMLAGFLKSAGLNGQRDVRHSSSWLAPALPGGPDVPVKITFDADFLGDIIVDLDAVSHAAVAACSSPPASGAIP